MTEGIPTLADALSGKPAIARGNGANRTARVHRINDDDRHLDAPLAVIPPPEVTPFPPFLKREKPPNEEAAMPTGHYDRTNRTAAMRAKKAGGPPPQVAAPKKKTKAKAGGKKPIAATPRANGVVRYSIDDAGGISLTPNEGDPIHLDANDTKRLELFLTRTKDLRK